MVSFLLDQSLICVIAAQNLLCLKLVEEFGVTIASPWVSWFKAASLKEKDISSAVNELVDVWWAFRQRRVALFGYAAHGFMQYLSYASSNLWEAQLAGSYLYSQKEKTASYTLRVMLYVLNILLNYGVELRDTLEVGLSTVPLLPWQEITPQLFAQLSSHPEQVVRKQLEGLLMMLAKKSPCSIVYLTLVDINAYELEPSE